MKPIDIQVKAVQEKRPAIRIATVTSETTTLISLTDHVFFLVGRDPKRTQRIHIRLKLSTETSTMIQAIQLYKRQFVIIHL